VKGTWRVYSTETGRVGPAAPRPVARPPGADGSLPDDGVVRLFRERAGRGGKVVTVVRGLPERGAALEARAGELRRLCGAGGTLRDGAVEIQGDHRERLAEHLRGLGYRVKLAGG
jgi:translation initiation factor 1